MSHGVRMVVMRTTHTRRRTVKRHASAHGAFYRMGSASEFYIVEKRNGLIVRIRRVIKHSLSAN